MIIIMILLKSNINKLLIIIIIKEFSLSSTNPETEMINNKLLIIIIIKEFSLSSTNPETEMP